MHHENLYRDLRALAVNSMRENPERFDIFFQDPGSTMQQELDSLELDGTYAGQECIVSLSQALGIDISVTYGGDIDNRIFTMEHPASNSVGISIHVVFSSIGNGHYDAVVDSESPSSDIPIITAHQSTSSNSKQVFRETPYSMASQKFQDVQPVNNNAPKENENSKNSQIFNSLTCKFCSKTLSSNSALKNVIV